MSQRESPGESSVAAQELCVRGQDALEQLDYRAAESLLSRAERLAFMAGDFDSLCRLYMPLQESRRQIRQRCAEGIFCQDLIAGGPDDPVGGERIIGAYPHGQLLVAGWGTVQPAVDVRRLAGERGLYVETFLAAVYPITGGGRAVVVIPLADVQLPPPVDRPLDQLIRLLPPHAVVLNAADLPAGPRKGESRTFSAAADLWERLHLPFLAAADSTTDPRRKIGAYRRAIEVDYAAELPHQRLSDTARLLRRMS